MTNHTKGFRWDDAKETYIRERLRENPATSHRELADYFGITENAVRKKLYRMGISVGKLRSGEFSLEPELVIEEIPVEEVWKTYEEIGRAHV